MNLKWIPNALTIARCLAGGLVIYAIMQGLHYQDLVQQDMTRDIAESNNAYLQQLWYRLALQAFIFGALTDFVDGWAARTLDATSRFGVWLDPIADKVLVGLTLVGLSMMLKSWLIYLPAAAIIGRDVFMTWFRTTPRGAAVVDPSNLAKWKTAFEMAAIILLMLPYAIWLPIETNSFAPEPISLSQIGLTLGVVALLWIAAFLSVYTATRYIIAANRSRT